MVVSRTGNYRTRAGSPVRIYAVDAGGEYPIHGAYMYPDEDADLWYLGAWKENGKFGADDFESAFDLIENVKRKSKGKESTEVSSDEVA